MSAGHVVTITPSTIPGAETIAGLLCFYDERVDVTVDGAPTRPPD
jgi:uncharacterized protein (DUF427 family)